MRDFIFDFTFAEDFTMSINNFEISVEDFEQQPRGPFLFNHWIAKQRVPTPLGDFSVEARTPMNDPEPPDERMLQQVNMLAAFVLADPDKILDKIYEHYQTVIAGGEMDAGPQCANRSFA
jgi:hypothetical protein